MGSTVSSRTNAKAAREVCQGTCAWDRPMPRRHASRTSHNVRLLAAVAAVIRQQRAEARAAARPRKPGQLSGGAGGQLPPGEPAGGGKYALECAAGADRERLAADQEAESRRVTASRGQAYGGGGGDRAGWPWPGPAGPGPARPGGRKPFQIRTPGV
jgi:hypothetical protein